MFSVLKKIFSNSACTGSSKIQAKSRLQFVLVQDRAGLSNEELASFRQELLCVIEKYFVVKENDFDIDYKRDGNATKLTINSPVVVKRDVNKNKIDCPSPDNGEPVEDKLEIRTKDSGEKKDLSNTQNFKKKKKVSNQ